MKTYLVLFLFVVSLVSGGLRAEPAAQLPKGEPWLLYKAEDLPPGKRLTVQEVINPQPVVPLPGETYLIGEFLVTASGANRTVLRLVSDRELARIVVEYPPGYPVPKEGTNLARNEKRPLLVTDKRAGQDGRTTIYVREVMQPLPLVKAE